MRMQQCPHCGAANSTRRETCYQCQQALGPSAETVQPAAGSRWERLERVPGRAARRVLRPVEEVSARPPAAPVLTPQPASSMPTFRRPLRHVRRMAVFFRELQALARAGVTIGAACQQLALRAPRPFRGLCREMAASAEAGEPLHEVMARHSDLFHPWHVGLVRAAQMGGALPEAFGQIARACELEWETRATILLRLFFYAVFLLPAVLVVIPLVLMLSQPIPEEGWTPGQLIGVALGYFRTVSLPIIVGLVAAALAWQALSATAWFQGIQHRIVAHLPLVGGAARAAALDRYLTVLGLLLRAGVSVGEAMEQAASAAGNAALTLRLLRAAAAVREGVPLSQALGSIGALDRDMLGMAAAGEVAGALPDMLEKAAEMCRRDFEARRRRLLIAFGVALSAFWVLIVGLVVVIGIRTYFDFMFRGLDWMMQG